MQDSIHARNDRRKRSRGFTLIEIIAVVVIIGLLTTLVGLNIAGQITKAKRSAAQAQIAQLESALEFYKLDNGRYPSTNQGLEALVNEPSGDPAPRNYPPGGYLKKRDLLMDPWGSPYEYASPGEQNPYGFDIWTLGEDGQVGGDDIGNWDEESPE
jgi:general secretion pathway protein G